MARSELVIELVKAALTQDSSRVKMLAESIVSEERQKEHHFVADQLSSVISQSGSKVDNTKNHSHSLTSNDSASSVVRRKTAEAKLSDIVLPEPQKQEITELIREQKHAQELIAHGVEPRSRVLLKGAPGNGKTMLAEVIATELGLPFLVVHYEDVVSSFLGETAGRLEKVFSEAAEAPCVLFLMSLMWLPRNELMRRRQAKLSVSYPHFYSKWTGYHPTQYLWQQPTMPVCSITQYGEDSILSSRYSRPVLRMP